MTHFVRYLAGIFAMLPCYVESEFRTITPQPGETRWSVQFSKPVKEVLVSWDAAFYESGTLEVSLNDLKLARISRGEKWHQQSFKGQSNAWGEIQTDTLVLKEPIQELIVSVTGSAHQLNKLYVWAGTGQVIPFEFNQMVKVGPVEVPMRCQANYPNGGVLCSPTSTSMVLAYWAQTLNEPILDHDVPAVVNGVWDTVYKGAGNWPFNTAFAASQPGMTGYVTRLRNVADLVAWIERGVPVICSVSYDLLQGKGKKGVSDGHLVVFTGLDGEGNALFNDPGRQVVKKAYRLRDFEDAWATSGNTVYLIYPRAWVPPFSNEGPWDRS